MQDYFPGATLPPHLSPFDIETDIYVPPEKKQLEARQKGEIPEDQMPQREDSESSDSEDDDEGKKKKKGGNQNIRPLESFEVRKKKKERSMFFLLYCLYVAISTILSNVIMHFLYIVCLSSFGRQEG